jgi:hypothetical protein
MKFWMHPNNLDVCLRERPDGGFEWWNLGYVGQPYFIDDALKPRNFSEWIDITEKVNQIRTKPGLPQ